MNKEEIFEIIVEYTKEAIPELELQDITRNDSLSDLGADSIDRSEIMIMTMESLGLKIPLVELAGARTIGELVDRLYAKL